MVQWGSPQLTGQTIGQPVGAKLKTYAKNWKGLDPWSHRIVEVGYEIPLESEIPIQKSRRMFYRTKEQSELLDKYVRELISDRAVKETRQNAGWTSELILAKKKDGTWRPCLDLRGFNQFVKYSHFKMEGLREVRSEVQQGDWLTSDTSTFR